MKQKKYLVRMTVMIQEAQQPWGVLHEQSFDLSGPAEVLHCQSSAIELANVARKKLAEIDQKEKFDDLMSRQGLEVQAAKESMLDIESYNKRP